MERIELQEAIAALRQQLAAAIEAAKDETLRFEVGELTLQFQVEVERLREGQGGLRFWVVEVGGRGATTTTRSHVVTVPLKPVTADGGPVLTGGRSVPG